jgi:hypothetical protein
MMVKHGATALSIATLSIKGLFATFSITAFGIMTISITMLCHYAECRILFTIMLSVDTLSVVILSVVSP